MSSGPTDAELNEVLSLVQSRVTPEMHQILVTPFTAAEVKQAIFAFELDHHLQSSQRSNGGYVAIKLDMRKTYDRVEWTFLHGVLLRLGFNHRFVGLIMMLVTIVSYSITLNDVFSCLIQDAEHRGRLIRVAMAPQAPRVSHLLLVDDTLVLCEATTEQISEFGGFNGRFSVAQSKRKEGSLGSMEEAVLATSSRGVGISGIKGVQSSTTSKTGVGEF
ncbi:UNVERIFIED_CONTAM: hypothetical protein Slati_3686400 [Sesamum latifolium]|uniref:Reverse transcriptase domain-containing protein n=1 Tax=Sesamum latifolium TaxID=2727402 RepID=A0AAW2U2A8_9LAMI